MRSTGPCSSSPFILPTFHPSSAASPQINKQEQQAIVPEIGRIDERDIKNEALEAVQLNPTFTSKPHAERRKSIQQLETQIKEKIDSLDFMVQPFLIEIKTLEKYFPIAQANRKFLEKSKSQASDKDGADALKKILNAYHASLHMMDIIWAGISAEDYVFRIIEKNEVSFISQRIEELKLLERLGNQQSETLRASEKYEGRLKDWSNKYNELKQRASEIYFDIEKWRLLDRSANEIKKKADTQQHRDVRKKVVTFAEKQSISAQKEIQRLKARIKEEINSLEDKLQPLFEKTKALEQALPTALLPCILSEKLRNLALDKSNAAKWKMLFDIYKQNRHRIDNLGHDILKEGSSLNVQAQGRKILITQLLQKLRALEKLDTQCIVPKASEEFEKLLASWFDKFHELSAHYLRIARHIASTWPPLDRSRGDLETLRKEKITKELIPYLEIALKVQSSDIWDSV